MEVVLCADAQAVGELAADRVTDYLQGIPTPVLGLATGSSPLRLYEELARRVEAGTLDVSHGLGFALDEYVGIDPGHPESYRSVITRTVVEPLRMDPARVSVPDGTATDLQAAADRYDAAIAAVGGVDVQILGIGTNGHIGFNEPFSSFASRTRIKTLTPETRRDNARFFDATEQVPVALRHPGPGHHHGGPRGAHGGHRRAQGGRRRRDGRGPRRGLLPGLDPAVPSAGGDHRRRGGRVQAEATPGTSGRSPKQSARSPVSAGADAAAAPLGFGAPERIDCAF